uniref:Uncharacterized protein n=1 Tax=Citrobacter freundii TaxID=546 RepID=A0A2L0W1Z1_CITFR|nr:Hypothetical protein [Citrobacter freundii]
MIIKTTDALFFIFVPLFMSYESVSAQPGVRLEKGNYPTLSAFFAQMATD